MSGGIVGEPTTGDMDEQCEHTEWVPEIESWVRCTANTLMHTPDTRVLCPAHCGCDNIDLGESGAA